MRGREALHGHGLLVVAAPPLLDLPRVPLAQALEDGEAPDGGLAPGAVERAAEADVVVAPEGRGVAHHGLVALGRLWLVGE